MYCVYLSAPFLCAEEVQNLRQTGQLCPPTPFWEGNFMSEFIPLSVPNFGEREADAARAAVLSGWVSTSGARVSEFEQAIADYLGMPRAVATNAGSSALHIAAMAAGIHAGDEVIVPTLTFIAAVNPLTRYIGAEPVFIGCDDSLCIDPDGVEDFCANHCTMRDGKLYNNKTGAHVAALGVVHVFGNMADMPRLMDIARRYGLILIEDATEALGTHYISGPLAGKFAGTMGDAGCYSFNGNKIITTGAGGMMVSNHPDWTEHAKHLSTQAKADLLQFLHDEVGYNYRMTNVQATLGLVQLDRLEGFIENKKARYEQYVAGLDGKKGLRILPFRDEAQGVRPNHWFFSLYLGESDLDRDTVIAKLQAQNIQTRPVWALIHEQADYPRNEAYHLDKALDYRKHIVNLPCSTDLTEQDCARVIDAVLAL